MDFDDIFKHGHKQNHGYDHHYSNEDHSHSSHSNNNNYELKRMLLNKLQYNPQFRFLLIIAAIILIIVVVVALILLFPLIIKLLHYLSENGIQGIINIIWNGTQ